jgi:hypothetical protein
VLGGLGGSTADAPIALPVLSFWFLTTIQPLGDNEHCLVLQQKMYMERSKSTGA